MNNTIGKYRKDKLLPWICLTHNDKYASAINEKGDRFVVGKDNTFHMMFRKSDGMTMKWGKKPEDNPDYCPYGNEIADIEITTSCRGIRNKDGVRKPCPFCYKSNQPEGINMSLETFKQVFDKLNKSKTMTQIAFGVDAECESNPDTFEIFQYAKDNGVTPNVTVADITKGIAYKITSLCGAAAVSAYQSNKDRCYDSVKLLIDSAVENGKMNFKCNIHAMLSAETYDFLFEVIDDAKNDSRLQGLNAIVFLSLKQRGRGEHFHSVSDEQFKKLFDYAMEKGVGVGFDSCSVPKFIKAIADRPNKDELESLSESCESCMFSAYINTKGEFYPCSFMEGMGEWKQGIDLTKVNDFVEDVWNDNKVVEWRNKSIQCLKCKGYNECQYFNV